jgi:hypothetical protein
LANGQFTWAFAPGETAPTGVAFDAGDLPAIAAIPGRLEFNQNIVGDSIMVRATRTGPGVPNPVTSDFWDEVEIRWSFVALTVPAPTTPGNTAAGPVSLTSTVSGHATSAVLVAELLAAQHPGTASQLAGTYGFGGTSTLTVIVPQGTPSGWADFRVTVQGHPNDYTIVRMRWERGAPGS